VIRRLFWLTLGAALGVTAYRRVVAFARAIPWPVRAGTVARIRSMAEFGSDVREGMSEYMDRHSQRISSTLEGHREQPGVTLRTDDERDGR
jgi:hypothetical protein